MGRRGPLKKLPLEAPAPTPGEPLGPPSWLPEAAVAVWLETEPALRDAGRLRPESREVFAQFCAVVLEVRTLTLAVASSGSTRDGLHGTVVTAEFVALTKTRGVLLALSKALGITPEAAARVGADSPSKAQTSKLVAYGKARDAGRPFGWNREAG